MLSFKCLNNPFDTLLNLCFRKVLREDLLFWKWRDQEKAPSELGRKQEYIVNYLVDKMLDNF